MTLRTPWTADIAHAATSRGLEADLIEAQVLVESSGRPWPWNPEPRYRYLWNVATGKPFRALTAEEQTSEIPPPDFPMPTGVDRDAEWWGQQASWGLMQIMGALARERGWKGADFPELCRVDLNLQIGCSIMADLFRWAKGDRVQALAAYNGGRGGWQLPGPKAYAAKVIGRSITLSTT